MCVCIYIYVICVICLSREHAVVFFGVYAVVAVANAGSVVDRCKIIHKFAHHMKFGFMLLADNRRQNFNHMLDEKYIFAEG